MSAISLKSITGITSITTPAGVDNQLTLHNNNTTEAVKLDVAGNLHFHNHLSITGISTAANFKTGTSNLHSTGLNIFDLDVDGHTNLDNVSIAGVTTVSNKTQVNSIGIGIIPIDHHHIHIESANPRILIRSTGTNASKIFFGDNSSNDPGVIEYAHSENSMRFNTGNLERLRITGAGDLSLRTTTQNAYLGLTANSTAINTTLGSTSGTNPRLYLKGVGNGSSDAGDVFIGSGTGGIIHIRSAESIKFEVNSDNTTAEALRITSDGKVKIQSGTTIQFTNTSNDITTDTSDGSDNKRIVISGGGATDSSRGANINLTGNEYSGANGKLELTAGNSGNSNGSIDCYTGGSQRLRITSGGSVTIGDSATHTFSAHSEGDDLVIGGAGWRGMTIYGEGGGGVIQFADNGDNRVGQILYYHAENSMSFRVNGNVDRLKIHNSGRVQIGAEVENTADIDTTNTRLTIKQSANSHEDGLYIERSGERRGYYMYVGGAGGYNDALCLTTNQLGTDTNILAIDRSNVLAKIGGSVIIDSSNNGYGGLRIYDDSSGDYNVRYIAGRNQGLTAHVFERGGRTQNQSPWSNVTSSEIARLTHTNGISFRGEGTTNIGQHASHHLRVKTNDKERIHIDNRGVLTAPKLNTKALVFSSCTTKWASSRSILKFYMDFYTGASSATYHFMRMISQPDWSFDDVTIKQTRFAYSPDGGDHATRRYFTYYGSHTEQIINYNQQGGASSGNSSNWISKRTDFGPGGAFKIHEAANGGYYRDLWGSDYSISLGNYIGVRLEITVYSTVGVYDTGTYATASDFYPAAFGGQATQSAADNHGGPRGVWFNTVANGTGSGSAPVLGIHQNNAYGWSTGSSFLDTSA